MASGAALPLLFPRHELGFQYAVGATVGGGEPTVAHIEDETYAPSSAAGCRLPHHWLRATDGAWLSTHDLLLGDGGSLRTHLTLLVDHAYAAQWATAVRLLRQLWGEQGAVPIRLVAIAAAVTEDAADLDGSSTGFLVDAADPAHPPKAFDPCGGWVAKRQVDSSGALLVRPDGHVAWRCGCAEEQGITTAEVGAERLLSVLRRVLDVGGIVPRGVALAHESGREDNAVVKGLR